MTMAMTAATARLTGMIKDRTFAEEVSRISRLASTQYATEESASEAKMGSARTFGRSVCSMRSVVMRRPTRIRLTMSLARGADGRVFGSISATAAILRPGGIEPRNGAWGPCAPALVFGRACRDHGLRAGRRRSHAGAPPARPFRLHRRQAPGGVRPAAAGVRRQEGGR